MAKSILIQNTVGIRIDFVGHRNRPSGNYVREVLLKLRFTPTP